MLILAIELRKFLEIIQFYRQFVKNYTDIVGSIYDIIKDNISEY